jgi:hypothetical protein
MQRYIRRAGDPWAAVVRVLFDLKKGKRRDLQNSSGRIEWPGRLSSLHQQLLRVFGAELRCVECRRIGRRL